MNIYSKKKAPDGNNNKNSKKINNKVTVYKRVIYDSPSNKNSGKNNANYSMDQSNNLSMELKKFVLRKLVDNAIKVEGTFNNYFNINNMPNKK